MWQLGEGQGQQQPQSAPAAQQKVEGPLVEEALRRQQQKAARERLTTREDDEEERAKVDKVRGRRGSGVCVRLRQDEEEGAW